MEKVQSGAKIIAFPPARHWAGIAEAYVRHMTQGDPRAAFYYLEYQLEALGLRKIPPILKHAIDREYRRRGFRGPIRFG